MNEEKRVRKEFGSGGAGRHQDLPELRLEVIAPIMKDVSPQAHRWWPLVKDSM